MRLGELLIAAGLANREQVAAALARQQESGGKLGENLVALGAVSPQALERFLQRVPAEPETLADTRLEPHVLLDLLIKLIYVERLETVSRIAAAIRLPSHLVAELVATAVGRGLLQSLGERDRVMYYAMTEAGVRAAQNALEHCRYAGPAPVALDDFTRVVRAQSIGLGAVTLDTIRAAFGELVVSERFLEQIGPALNAGRAMLLYGPPGNGKTSVAHCISRIFNEVVHIPYAVIVGGNIIRVFDPNLHVRPQVPVDGDEAARLSLRRAEAADPRWVACVRPLIVAGGELTLAMLDLQFNAVANFYEAPLHLKALGGCFVIDDFGRQLAPPSSLLNRWIVPMEHRVDYLTLHTGQSFAIPFEELLIFSTNLHPEDLMDPAFLRRIPYKFEIGAPDAAAYRSIFERVCRQVNLTLTGEVFDSIVHRITAIRNLELAAYQPRFIVDQIVATCRFLQQPVHFEQRFIDYAVDNLAVRRTPPHPAASHAGAHDGGS